MTAVSGGIKALRGNEGPMQLKEFKLFRDHCLRQVAAALEHDLIR